MFPPVNCPCTRPWPVRSSSHHALQVVTNEEPRIIECAGSRTTPSVVSFQADGSVLVGNDAKRRAAGVNPVLLVACCQQLDQPHMTSPVQALGARPRQHILQREAAYRERVRRRSRGCGTGAALVIRQRSASVAVRPAGWRRLRQQLIRTMAAQVAYDVMMDEDEAVVLPCRHTEEGVRRASRRSSARAAQ